MDCTNNEIIKAYTCNIIGILKKAHFFIRIVKINLK